MVRSAILAAANNAPLQRFVTRYGFSLGAGRFVAGETVDDFLRVTAQLNKERFAVACGILGEGITQPEQAADATSQYCAMLHTFAQRGLDANVAFKLTHVGLDISRDLALQNARRIASVARETGNSIRLDMEQSSYVDATLDIFRALRDEFSNVGCVLQSYLHRSVDDLLQILPLAPSVRVVKGAYLEPPSIAFASKRDVDANYVRLVEMLFDSDAYAAIATHDERIIETVKAMARHRALPRRGKFEFQMLYGIAGESARSLVSEGYRVRLAVPFGTYWFPYLMRRLAERPANLAFFLKGAFRR